MLPADVNPFNQYFPHLLGLQRGFLGHAQHQLLRLKVKEGHSKFAIQMPHKVQAMALDVALVKGSKGYITRFYHYPFW